MPRVEAYSITAKRVEEQIAATGGELVGKPGGRKRKGGNVKDVDLTKVIALDTVMLPDDLGPNQVRVKLTHATIEHNVVHMGLADTLHIVEARGEERDGEVKLNPGNSAGGVVTEVGSAVTYVKLGDRVITHCNGSPHPVLGVAERIWAYDEPNSIGWYAKEAVLGEWQLVRYDPKSSASFEQWVALALRGPTAWHLWRRAIGIYRAVVSRDRRAKLTVLTFGGAVSENFCELASAEGHQVFYCAGNAQRRQFMADDCGAIGIDQMAFNRFATPDDLKAWNKEVKRLTDGWGMDVVCDMMRGKCWEAGYTAMAMCGVNVSAGWQEGQAIELNTTLLSVRERTVSGTHYESPEGCRAVSALYGDALHAQLHPETFRWEKLPDALQAVHQNTLDGTALIEIQ